ncbi:MAG TPA: 23S rRNA pseudouridine(1911/1915/1917) synthase RluD [Burkholderiales bacterium]|nr:23S rRNA pseudouridine(1911/1915/1917) synthase RluD [Burkholderiales bacterium]
MAVAGRRDAADYSAATERLIPVELAGLRLDQALAQVFPEHSRSRLQVWVRAGRVLLDAHRADDVKRKVWGGERVALTVPPDSTGAAARAEAIPLSLLHEDAVIVVIDKPAGLVVHPGAGNWQGTLLNALLHHFPRLSGVPRAGIVHRLDRDTSGLLVVAKTVEAHTNLVRQLAARTVKREYLAIVHGRVAGDGAIDAPIGRHPVARTRMAVTARGREARTRYRVVERFDAATILAVSLETGRTHQIRVHMRAIGHPLVGDPTYGKHGSAAGPLASFPRQALHAARLGLVHPVTGAPWEWESPLPADLGALIESLR